MASSKLPLTLSVLLLLLLLQVAQVLRPLLVRSPGPTAASAASAALAAGARRSCELHSWKCELHPAGFSKGFGLRILCTSQAV
jgi:hypothetical protein